MSTSIISLDLIKYEEDLHLSMDSSVEAEAVQAQLGKELPTIEDHKSVLRPQEGVSYAIVTPNSEWAVVLDPADYVSESASIAPFWEPDSKPAHPDLFSEDYSERMSALNRVVQDVESEWKVAQVLHWALRQDGEMAIEALGLAQEREVDLDRLMVQTAKNIHRNSATHIDEEADAYLAGEDIMEAGHPALVALRDTLPPE